MNTHPTISRQDAADLAAAINERNARTLRRADSALDVLLAVFLALLGAMALLHFLDPCGIDGAMCSLMTLVWPRKAQPEADEHSDVNANPAQPQHPDDRLGQALHLSYRQGHDDGEFSGYTEGWRLGLFNGLVIGIGLGALAVFSAFQAGWLFGA